MIRTATTTDIEKLYALYEAHRLDAKRISDIEYTLPFQQNGFILESDTNEEFAKEVEESILTLVSEEEGSITGFVLINAQRKFVDNEHVVWTKPDYQSVYESSDGMGYIHQLIVHPDYKRSKKGSEIIAQLIQELPDKHVTHIFSSIIVNPIVNMASIPFLSKNDFEIVAITYPHDTNGFEKYMSILMGRRIS